MGDDLITAREAAKLLDVTPARVRQLMLARRVSGRKFGDVWAVDTRSLNDYRAARRRAA